MDFDITFNDGLNFIIGVNGTGKTTILNLLKGLLIPSNQISKESYCYYDYISVECDDKGKNFVLKSTKEKESIEITKEVNGETISKTFYFDNPSQKDESFVHHGISYLGLDRLNNYSDDALNNIKNTLYHFVRQNITKKNIIEKDFRDSIVALTQQPGDKDQKLKEITEEYNKKISEINKPLTRFVDSTNLFFSEGNKVLQVDDTGEIQIIIKGVETPATIFDLSSGEKQLIIMLGHIIFDNSTVVIIDEPELSLHLSWQYKFADALLTANPDAQYILATHAAGIVAKKSNEQYCIDLTPKYND